MSGAGPCHHGRPLRGHVDLRRQRAAGSPRVGAAEPTERGAQGSSEGQGKTGALWWPQHGGIPTSSQTRMDTEGYHFGIGEVGQAWRTLSNFVFLFD